LSSIDAWFQEKQKYKKLLAKNKKIPLDQAERASWEFITRQKTLEKLFSDRLKPKETKA